MSRQARKPLITVLAVFGALMLLGALAVSPAAAQAPRTFLDWLLVDQVTVLQGDLDVLVGDVSVGADLNLTGQTAISVTNGTAFAPTGSYQPLESAGEVTSTITIGSAGDVVVLVNTSDTTINIADTGTTMLSAAAALGQYDSLTLLSDGTNWIEVSRSDN